MTAIPAYYEAAKKNLKIQHLNIQHLHNSSKFRRCLCIRTRFECCFEQSKLDLNEKREIREKAEIAVMAIKEANNWLKELKHYSQILDWVKRRTKNAQRHRQLSCHGP
jgi:hypothetical protein